MVALRPTAETGTPQARARFSRIRSRYGESLGACAAIVDIQLKAVRAHDLHHARQQDERVGALVRGVGVGEEPADVAEPTRPQDGVRERVRDDVGVGVAVKPAIVRNVHAAQDQAAALGEGVDVIAVPDVHAHAYRASNESGATSEP